MRKRVTSTEPLMDELNHRHCSCGQPRPPRNGESIMSTLPGVLALLKGFETGQGLSSLSLNASPHVLSRTPTSKTIIMVP